MKVNISSNELLIWYDTNARRMPWRVCPTKIKAGVKPDPYKVWLSEIMLQQTTVATVKSYFINFVSTWPTISDLAKANDNDVMAAWAGLGYYARARNLLKCARIIMAQFNGIFPHNINELQKLPGIGPYTSAAISAIAFDKPNTVMDGNVERVMSRVYAIHKPLPLAKPQLFEGAQKITPKFRAGDYAQAVMDLGSTVCIPKNPKCNICPWGKGCLGRQKGIAITLPNRVKRPAKRNLYGIIYVVQREDGAWLLEKRKPKGLLGGMLGWPSSDWSNKPHERAPINAEWATSSDTLKHIFSHFTLYLTVKVTKVPLGTEPTIGEFYNPNQFLKSDLPKLMQKVFDTALSIIKKNPT